MKKKNVGSLDTVDAILSDCSEWMEISDLPRTLLGGTREMKEAGEKYLPKEEIEKAKAYNNRLFRSSLVNMYSKTVSFLSGQVFSKPIVFNDETPKELMVFQEDADTSGNSITTFCKRVFEIGIGEGVCHIFIDSTNVVDQFTNKLEEKEAGVRSFFRMIKGKDIRGFIDKDGVLVQVRINETKVQRNGRFGIDIIPQIRVLELGKWEVYQEESGRKWALVDSGKLSIDSLIPIVSFIPGKPLSIMTGETPLMDLAELNLNHWQSKSDQTNILHICRAAFILMKCIDMDKVTVSAQSAVISDNKDAEIKYIEHSGKAIEAGQKDLTEIEAKMALYGLQQLVPRSGNMTATEKAISSAESNSSLGNWVSIFQGVVRTAFYIAAMFENIENEYDAENVTVNKDFTSGIIDPEMVLAYLRMVELNVLSAASAFSEIKKKGFISEDLDWLDVKAEMDLEKKDKEGQSLIPFGNFGNQEE